MKKNYGLSFIIFALALLNLGCEQTPTMPAEKKQLSRNQLLAELRTPAQIEHNVIEDLPPGLDIRPGTPIPFWARIEPSFPNGIPEADGWGVIISTSKIPTPFRTISICSTFLIFAPWAQLLPFTGRQDFPRAILRRLSPF
jgi:hypothetical protein